MKMLALWVLATSLLIADAGAHGAFYPSPPPVGPPPGGGSGNPLPAPDPAPPTTPAPTPPSPPTGGYNGTGPVPTGHPPRARPAPKGPSTGGPKAPALPPATGAPQPAGPNTGRPAPIPISALTGAQAANPDLGSWETWWFFNQERYLQLKAHVSSFETATGSDEALLGRGTTSGAVDTGATVVSERVVPALLALLERDRQQDVVTGATMALARIADGPLAARAGEFSRAFAPFLSDPNQEIAETSILARGLVGDESAALELVALLEDADTARVRLAGHSVAQRSRAFAGFALGLLGAHSRNEDLKRFIVHHLVRTLREDAGATPDVHVACVLALGLTPLSWSEDDRDAVRAPVTTAGARRSALVATASRETQMECLLAVLADEKGDRWVRAHVPGALSRLVDGATEPVRVEVASALLQILAPQTNACDEVVQGCVLALGRVGGSGKSELDARVRATLQRVVLGGDQQSRRFALVALAQCAGRAGPAEAELGTAETRAFLTRRLSEGRSPERMWAALALGLLEHERTASGESGSIAVRTNLLLALKDSGSADEVGALAIACGLSGDLNAVPILIQKLERTADARAQGHIAVGLGLIGDLSATRALRTQLAEARFKPELLRDTAIGLALLEDRELVPTLVETLGRATSLASQSASAAVIGWIGDRRAIEPLLSLLTKSDVSASARGFAAAALGRVCDRDRLPWNAVVTEDIHYRAATATLMAGDGTGLLEIL